MNKLLIAALALGAIGFTQSATAAPAVPNAPVLTHDEGLVQKAFTSGGHWKYDRDRDEGRNRGYHSWNREGNRGYHYGWNRDGNRGYHRGWNRGRDWYGRDNRTWRDDNWRRNRGHNMGDRSLKDNDANKGSKD